MYKLLRALLFKLDAERSHELAIRLLAAASHRAAVCSMIKKVQNSPVTGCPVSVMGLNFPNRVGLAAGLDKHAQCINALSALGFGFVEAGTVTPEPQPGNEKPRLFRLTDSGAIINRMGFNSVGLNQFINNYDKHAGECIVGINLGKNANTPMERAMDDYLTGLRRVYTRADYITINLSSPNTKNLRDLQQGEAFARLLKNLKREQAKLTDENGQYTPVAIKIAPDLYDEEIESIAVACLKHNVDALIATNTSTSREMIAGHPLAGETGGLSGQPIKTLSTGVIRAFAQRFQGQIPIIGAGGIFSAQDAAEKIQAGASLVQVYTGFIYKGPGLIRQINQRLSTY